MTTLDFDQAHREILWNVGTIGNVVTMYALFALAMVVFSYGLWRRLQLWSSAKPKDELLGDWGQRTLVLLRDVIAQRKVVQDKHARVFHSLIVWGFLILLFTTTMVFIDHDLGIDIYEGKFYLAVTLLSDLFGLLLLVGVMHALYVRYINQPDKLNSTVSDSLMLIFLAAMVVQGFLLEGLRIHATDDPWKYFSPVGWLVAEFFWNLSSSGASFMHYITWWVHTITVFAFIALLPYTKFFHIFSSSANLYFQTLERPKGALPYPGDLEKLMEEAIEAGGDFSLGVSTLQDLTWKDYLNFDSCTSCGRCQDVCPAYNSGKILSPKWLILDSRNHMLQLHAEGKLETNSTSLLPSIDSLLLKSFTLNSQKYSNEGAQFHRAENPLVQNAAGDIGQSAEQLIAGDVMDADVFWACTTCRACMEVCPVGIEHVDYIVEARRGMALMRGELPSEAQPVLRAIETRGNPFGAADARSDWMDGLEVPILEPGSSVDILYWVGCISAFDKRKQNIARAMVHILNASGVSWGTLGNRECCTGDAARRLGDENIFQSSAKQNIATLASVHYKRIVANCPHCFNSLKNEYPQVASDGESALQPEMGIIHHSQLIKELLDSKKLVVKENILDSLTYHDPCYLGRYNDTYQEPRDILVQLGSKPLKEMKDSRERGKCCGAGGGHYWFDMKVGERVNAQRIDQVLDTGASTVATGCPFCLQMLEDGAKLRDAEDIKIRDIAELVAEALIREERL